MIIINPKIIKPSSSKITFLSKPVVFMDSCMFIEFIYNVCPSKDRNNTDIENAFKIFNSVFSGNVQLITSEICIKEINDNYETAIKVLTHDIKVLNERIEIIYQTDKKYLGISPAEHTNLTHYNLVDSIKLSVKSLLEKTLFIKCTSEIKENSHIRTLNKLPPSDKKSQYKDCIVWETCLVVKSNLEADLVFATVNKSDFFDNGSFKPHLKTEADLIGVLPANNLNRIYSFLNERHL